MFKSGRFFFLVNFVLYPSYIILLGFILNFPETISKCYSCEHLIPKSSPIFYFTDFQLFIIKNQNMYVQDRTPNPQFWTLILKSEGYIKWLKSSKIKFSPKPKTKKAPFGANLFSNWYFYKRSFARFANSDRSPFSSLTWAYNGWSFARSIKYERPLLWLSR